MGENESLAIGAKRRVALVVESSGASGCAILRGIARYAREHGPWSFDHEPGHWPEALPPWLRRFRGDGVIARVRNRRMAATLTRLRVPVVDVQCSLAGLDIPLVQVDDEAVARLGAEHFLQRGFRHFGFCGIDGPVWAERRAAAFVAALAKAGRTCSVYEFRPPKTQAWFSEGERANLARWMCKLPRPAAIMAANDRTAHRLLEAARRAGLMVPEEVAVLGVDNDETVCEICDPLLSSIIPVHDQVGYRAAELLDRMIDGAPAPAEPLFLKPNEVVVRRSSDTLAIEDPDVAAAVRFIWEQACRGIGVEDVARHVALSYSTLKRRFHKSLARSIHAEILRVRLERVRELLSATDLPLARVAEVTGFEHQEYLGAVFKARTGKTPLEYRRETAR